MSAVNAEAPGPTLSDSWIARAEALSAATLHEAAGRTGALPHTLKPIDPHMKVAGRALPVRCPSGDNLQIHLALIEARPGDVLVIDTGLGVDFGYWGEIMATAAIACGLKGLVIGGGVRDTLRLIELGLPTFATGVTVRGTIKDRSRDGAVGEPIRFGDVVVRRGDLVMGDADGVVAFAADAAPGFIEAGERRDAAEVEILSRLQEGATTLDVYRF